MPRLVSERGDARRASGSYPIAVSAPRHGPASSNAHFGRRRSVTVSVSVTVIAGLDPAIGSGDGSAGIPLGGADSAGTDPRDESVDDETDQPVDDRKRPHRPKRELLAIAGNPGAGTPLGTKLNR